MLTHLRIHDFALLDDVELELGPGFNVLTGETGAGKSLLVEAVALLRGGRASADVVRAGAEEARVEAVFEPPHGPAAEALRERLARAGIDEADEGLIVKRVISKSGRGRVYINNTPATAAALTDVAGVLIELAGQHEHQTLSDPVRHLAILDAFAGNERLVAEAGEAYDALVAAATAEREATLDERARAEREDFLSFQVKELEEAGLTDGEEAALKVERDRLRSVEKLERAARRGEDAIYGREGAIVEELAAIIHDLADVGRIDPELARLGKQIEEARVLLDDAAGDLRRYGETLSADPQRLEEVEDRLHLFSRLFKKHHVDSVAALVARRDALRKELNDLARSDERRAELAAATAKARATAAQRAAALSEARAKAARTLATRVEKALAELAMRGARVDVALAPRAEAKGDDAALVFDGKRLARDGWDRAEFLFSANQGEPARALAKVASGGELSRIMLALKRILSRADQVATYVFDEVDTGIGGAVAEVVGRQIAQVAHADGGKQVVCITHLAQIAACAETHFRVEKGADKGRVRTVVKRLTPAERREEIARMLGGTKITDKARAHAEEMLKAARA